MGRGDRNISMSRSNDAFTLKMQKFQMHGSKGSAAGQCSLLQFSFEKEG